MRSTSYFQCSPSPAGEVACFSLASVQSASYTATRMILQNTELSIMCPFTDSIAWRQSLSSLLDTQGLPWLTQACFSCLTSYFTTASLNFLLHQDTKTKVPRQKYQDTKTKVPDHSTSVTPWPSPFAPVFPPVRSPHLSVFLKIPSIHEKTPWP